MPCSRCASTCVPRRSERRPAELYAAVPEMCAWAENHGGLAAVLCEHHGSEDGYLPSPLMLASGGRRAYAASGAEPDPASSVLRPGTPRRGHGGPRHPQRWAGVVHPGAGVPARGVRALRFALSDRGRLADEKLPLLRRLLAGETVVHDGRRITVTPRPQTPGGPGLMWGGGTLAAARRAGRYGLGMLGNANVAGMREAYEAACRKARPHSRARRSFPTATPRRSSSLPTTSTRRGRRLGRASAARRAGLRRVESR